MQHEDPRQEGERRGYALVTGASRGLGRAFAEAAAQQGWNLLLAALPGEGLPELAASLARSRGVRCRALELDLAREEDRLSLIAAAEELDRPLGLLVNNAGIGDNGRFDRIPLAAQRKTVALNVQATLELTYGLLPALSRGRGSRIITVASLAAFQPMPLFAVYAASKAFLLSWGLALREELRPLGIGFTVLAPGGVYTSEAIREKTRAQGLLGRLSTWEPEAVAELALRKAATGAELVIPGAFNRLLALLGTLVPQGTKARAVHRRWQKALSRVRGTEDAGYFSLAEREGRVA